MFCGRGPQGHNTRKALETNVFVHHQLIPTLNFRFLLVLKPCRITESPKCLMNVCLTICPPTGSLNHKTETEPRIPVAERTSQRECPPPRFRGNQCNLNVPPPRFTEKRCNANVPPPCFTENRCNVNVPPTRFTENRCNVNVPLLVAQRRTDAT